MDKIKKAWAYVQKAWTFIFNGHFMVSFVRWMTLTGGNIAESMFLLATLWVTINAVAHPLLLHILPTATIEVANYLAITAFSIVPELIIIPLIITCYSHWSLVVRRKSKPAWLWAVLYTVPALIFLGVTVMTIASFVSAKGTVDIQLDGNQLVIRCLSGWWYSTVNMLFAQSGKQQYADMLDEKDATIAQITEAFTTEKSQMNDDFAKHQNAMEESFATQKANLERSLADQKANLESVIERLKGDLGTVTIRLEEQSNQARRLAQRAESLERSGLEDYPRVVSEWIDKGVKTAMIDEIVEVTGHQKRKLIRAPFQRSNRNKDLILISSVIDWLKVTPPPETSHQNGCSKVLSMDEYLEMEA
jgi:hypothetical protein